MNNTPPEQQLLFGLLAMQLGYINREQLCGALSKSAVSVERDLQMILRDEETLSFNECRTLTDVCSNLLSRHCDSIHQSISALQLADGVMSDLAGSVPPELKAVVQRGQPTKMPVVSSESAIRFQYIRSHRKGGLGEVFLASDAHIQRNVALKEILPKHAYDPESQSRFRLEAEVTGALEHPGIVPIYDLGQWDDGRPYYAMRFIHGRSLTECIDEFHAAYSTSGESAEKQRALRRLLRNFLDVCNTLSYAHKRDVLHRDLKPDNIMIGDHGETLVVDWGLAKVTKVKGSPDSDTPPVTEADAETEPGLTVTTDLKATRVGDVAGTRGYMSPEQATGRTDDLSPASDVYSLGVILWELVTNRSTFPPGQIESAIEQLPEGTLPDELLDICRKATAAAQDERYSSANELAEAVDKWMADEPLAIWRADITRFEELVSSSPASNEYREALARSNANLALVIIGLRRFDEAEELIQKAISEFESLVDKLKRAPQLRAELIGTLALLSRLYRMQNRHDDAAKVRSRIDEQTKALTDDPLIGTEIQPGMASMLMSMSEFQSQEAKDANDKSSSKATDSLATFHPGDTSVARTEAEADHTESDSLATCPDESRLSESQNYSTIHPTSAYKSPEEDLLKSTGFKIRSMLGQGAFSSVYLAYDAELDRDVALKIAKPSDRDQRDTLREILQREARVIGRLDHPQICPAYGVGKTSDGNPFIVLKYLEGTSFNLSVDELRMNRSEPKLLSVLRTFSHLCRVLDYAHQKGVIHGDPKPNNVIVDDSGLPTIMDWGLARAPWVADWGEEGQIIGTPAYMSPEQARGEPVLSSASDIFALGATLFEILTGERHVSGPVARILLTITQGEYPSVQDVAPAVPDRLASICDRAMAFECQKRWPSAASLADELDSCLESLGKKSWNPFKSKITNWVTTLGTKSSAPTSDSNEQPPDLDDAAPGAGTGLSTMSDITS